MQVSWKSSSTVPESLEPCGSEMGLCAFPFGTKTRCKLVIFRQAGFFL